MSSQLLQPCCNASNVALIFRSVSLFSPTRTPTVCTGTDFSTKKIPGAQLEAAEIVLVVEINTN